MTSTQEQLQDDLWEKAYVDLAAENPELLNAYKDVLRKEAAGVSPDASVQEQVANIVTSKRRQILKKQWRLQWGHRSIKIRSQIDRVVKLIEAFKNVGNVASNADPVHAGLPWAGICLLLVPILHDVQQGEALMTGLTTITDIVARYGMTMQSSCTFTDVIRAQSPCGDGVDYQFHELSNPLNQKFAESVTRLYKKVLEFQISAALYLGRGTLSRILRNIPKLDGWETMLNVITRLDLDCGRYLSLVQSRNANVGVRNVMLALRDEGRRLEELLKSRDQQDQKVMRLARSLSAVNVGQDHADARSRLGKKYWGSGQWLLQHPDYIAWCESRTQVLWLRGLVGSGKTCLASIVIQDVLENKPDHKIAFFYCSQQERETAGDALRHGSCEPADVLRSILAQMSCDIDGDSSSPLQGWLESHASLDASNAGKTSAYPNCRLMSTAECIELLIETICLQGSTILLIDALDECYDPDELLAHLEIIQNQSDNVQIFLTSRVSVDNDFNFPEARIIENFNSSSDIQVFIDHETTLIERTRRSGITPAQAEDFKYLLASRAEGMFRWVELQIDIVLNKKFPLRHPRDVDIALKKIRHESGHPSLDNVYDQVFELNTQGQTHVHGLAIKALNWVLCCFKPLTLESLVEAVALDSNGKRDPVIDQSFVLQMCSNLIRVTDAGVVKVAHRSVREYLARGKVSEKNDRHIQAAETCFGFLTSLEHSPDFDNLLLDPRDEVPNIEMSDFQMYASLLWSAHCERVLNTDADLFRRILGPLINRFLLPRGAGSTTNRSYQKWNNLLWRVFHSDYEISETLRQRLEDAICLSANPLLATCVWGFADQASSLLLQQSLNVEGTNHREKTPLFLASERGDIGMIKILLSHSSNLDVLHPVWGSCLQAAAWSGSLISFEYLLGHGFEMNADAGCYGRTLDAAIAGGNSHIVISALRQGAEVWMPTEKASVASLGREALPLLPPKKTTARPQILQNERLVTRTRLNADVSDSYNEHQWHRRSFKDRLQLVKARQRQLILCRSSLIKSHPRSSPGSFACIRPDSQDSPNPQSLESYLWSCHEDVSNGMSGWLYELFGDVSFHQETCFAGIYPITQYQSGWRSHVLRDLWPYICPIDSCSSREKLYSKRTEWEWHVLFSHDIKLVPLSPAAKYCCSSELAELGVVKPAACLQGIMHSLEAEAMRVLSEDTWDNMDITKSTDTENRMQSCGTSQDPSTDDWEDEWEDESSSSNGVKPQIAAPRRKSSAIRSWSSSSSIGSDYRQSQPHRGSANESNLSRRHDTRAPLSEVYSKIDENTIIEGDGDDIMSQSDIDKAFETSRNIRKSMLRRIPSVRVVARDRRRRARSF